MPVSMFKECLRALHPGRLFGHFEKISTIKFVPRISFPRICQGFAKKAGVSFIALNHNHWKESSYSIALQVFCGI